MKITMKGRVWVNNWPVIRKCPKGRKICSNESLGSSKGEWTSEEDETLPMQWRTIGPLVGRSPSQCLERYEKLNAAGIDDARPRKRKIRDYDEDKPVGQRKFPTTIEEFEGETRVDHETPPRPPADSVELSRHSLMRAEEDKNSTVPPTDIEQADEIVRKELLSLLEHDNAKYPLSDKEKRKGVTRISNGVGPVIDDFEEVELLKEASSLIEEEAQYLRRAMGHEGDSLEAHRTCLNDLMYFPTRSSYGLSSVAATAEKLSALHNEFEHVKRKMDDDIKKAQRSERKVDIRTNDYKAREAKLREQVDLTINKMNRAATELDCLLALERQEKAAASLRIKSLWEEVEKQKELETSLQKRYGDAVAELEKIQVLMEQYKIEAQQLEELEAKTQAEDDEAKKQTEELASEVPEPVSMMMDVDVFNDVDPEVGCVQNEGDTLNSDGNAGEAVESDNIEVVVTSREKEPVGGEGDSTSGIVGKEAMLDGDEGGLSSDVTSVRNPLWQRIKSYIVANLTSFDR